MGSTLPFRSFALFRRVRGVKRGDIVLVDHPRFGLIVRRVTAVSRTGRVALRGMGSGMARSSSIGSHALGSVDHDRIVGRLALKMRWGRFLPGFSAPRTYAEHNEPEDPAEDRAEAGSTGAQGEAEAIFETPPAN